MPHKILVIDDEKQIVEILSYAFVREGLEVLTAFSGQEALDVIATSRPQLIVLDLMLPDMTGFEVCRRMDQTKETGIILLTAKDDIVDKVVGFELGADDYITKPFHIREVLARVQSLLRRIHKRNEQPDGDLFTYGELQLIRSKRKVTVSGQPIILTPKEFDLLNLFVSHIDRVYTRDELLDILWGFDYAGSARTVDIHLQRLRKKLGTDFQHLLVTVHGVGYKASRNTGSDES
ncbi:response regulator transcription factor [Paenibacillus sp. FJAT-26967]|uniref:response regulator transcription factor n=1 Tax=Paenibacillus sp. FJAT-26967 TaxID=1729690 RepID=UPI00083940D2|nr:response regulator transcription factor [Paenibacillus sp. FJAT-26967]